MALVTHGRYSPGGSIIDGQGRPRINVQWGSAPAPQWVAVEYNNCYLGCIGRDTLPVIIRPPFGILGTVEACAGTNQSFSAKQIPGGSAVACNWELFLTNGLQPTENQLIKNQFFG